MHPKSWEDVGWGNPHPFFLGSGVPEPTCPASPAAPARVVGSGQQLLRLPAHCSKGCKLGSPGDAFSMPWSVLRAEQEDWSSASPQLGAWSPSVSHRLSMLRVSPWSPTVCFAWGGNPPSLGALPTPNHWNTE